MRVAIVGAEGQLGTDVVAAFDGAGHEVRPLRHADMEITDSDSVARALDTLRPELIVNAAAKHHVETCETRPAEAYAVNALGPLYLARWAQANDAALLQVSTDYVFDGASNIPYDEGAPTRPLNVYGHTKLSGEALVLGYCARAWVVRVSGLYGTAVCRDKGPNFVDKMLRLGREREVLRVVDDEVLTPTPTADVARQFVALAEHGGCRGIVHASAGGACSWYELTVEIAQLAGLPARVERAEPGEFPVKVQRPAYSVLSNSRLRAAGIDVMPTWRDGLRAYIQAVGALRHEAVSG